MKKIITLILLVFVSFAAFSQAKKPTLMVVPSDSYCDRNGFTQYFTDEAGNKRVISDYTKAFSQAESEELRLVISELSKIMAERGFPLKDLEQTLKSIKQTNVERDLLTSSSGSIVKESPIDVVKRTAKADIILDLDFSVKTRGPQKFITFNLRGVDAYSNKIVAAASGDGKPSTSASVGILLEEAVINYIDDFNDLLQKHFNDMFDNGREIVVVLNIWDNVDFDFDTEYEYMGETGMLVDIIDVWMDDHCVQSRFSRTSNTENMIHYEQVRIPLYKMSFGKERAIDARGFISDLSSFLKKAPFYIDSKIYDRGLGEVWLILGEK
ncbi:DUF6175 family protein [Bacteroidales bacterium OttesenSCG-928-K03]|nr:DUF6175 family protein [Bacteroidales bacterium OttesenSCG-928-K03]